MRAARIINVLPYKYTYNAIISQLSQSVLSVRVRLVEQSQFNKHSFSTNFNPVYLLIIYHDSSHLGFPSPKHENKELDVILHARKYPPLISW